VTAGLQCVIVDPSRTGRWRWRRRPALFCN